MNPFVHIDRARVMVAAGKSAEAKFYLRHLALSSLRHARSLSTGAYRQNACNLISAATAREEGMVYALASRLCRGVVVGADVTFGFWEPAKNTFWPDLSADGIFVQIHDYHDKRGGVCVEVQVLAPDQGRSQCCSNRRFKTRAEGEAYGRKWVTVGRAVVAATEGAAGSERPGKADWDAVFGETPKKTKRLRPGRAA